MTEIKAVVFDYDGVVAAGNFADQLEHEYGIGSEQQSDFWDIQFAQAAVGQADFRAMIPAFIEKWGLQISSQDFLSAWCQSGCIENTLALKITTELRKSGLPVYLATNQEPYRSEYLRSQMDFDRRFAATFTSHDLGVMKPDAAFFEAISTRLGLQPAEILFIDNSKRNVDAARSFGWQASLYEFDPSNPSRKDLLAALRGKDSAIDRVLNRMVQLSP